MEGKTGEMRAVRSCFYHFQPMSWMNLSRRLQIYSNDFGFFSLNYLLDFNSLALPNLNSLYLSYMDLYAWLPMSNYHIGRSTSGIVSDSFSISSKIPGHIPLAVIEAIRSLALSQTSSVRKNGTTL